MPMPDAAVYDRMLGDMNSAPPPRRSRPVAGQRVAAGAGAGEAVAGRRGKRRSYVGDYTWGDFEATREGPAAETGFEDLYAQAEAEESAAITVQSHVRGMQERRKMVAAKQGIVVPRVDFGRDARAGVAKRRSGRSQQLAKTKGGAAPGASTLAADDDAHSESPTPTMVTFARGTHGGLPTDGAGGGGSSARTGTSSRGGAGAAGAGGGAMMSRGMSFRHGPPPGAEASEADSIRNKYAAIAERKQRPRETWRAASREEQERAAVTIQSRYRGSVARDEATQKRAVNKVLRERAVTGAAATRVQAVVRGKRGRARAEQVGRDRAATRVQATFRGKRGRLDAERHRTRRERMEQDRAAIRMQAVQRGAMARKQTARMVQQQHEDEAVRHIQAAARGKLAKHAADRRRRYVEEDAATKRIQAVARGHSTRERMRQQRKVEKALELRRARHVAATRIQSMYRATKDRSLLARKVRELQRRSAEAFVRAAARLRAVRATLTAAVGAFLAEGSAGSWDPCTPETVHAAHNAVAELRVDDVKALAHVPDPPLALASIARAVCILLGETPLWSTMVKLINARAPEPSLLMRLVETDPVKVPFRDRLVAGKIVRENDLLAVAWDTSNEPVLVLTTWIVATVGSAAVRSPTDASDSVAHGPAARASGTLRVYLKEAHMVRPDDRGLSKQDRQIDALFAGDKNPYVVVWMEPVGSRRTRHARGVWQGKSRSKPRQTDSSTPRTASGNGVSWPRDTRPLLLPMADRDGEVCLWFEAWDSHMGGDKLIGFGRMETLAEAVESGMTVTHQTVFIHTPAGEKAGKISCNVTYSHSERRSSMVGGSARRVGSFGTGGREPVSPSGAASRRPTPLLRAGTDRSSMRGGGGGGGSARRRASVAGATSSSRSVTDAGTFSGSGARASSGRMLVDSAVVWGGVAHRDGGGGGGGRDGDDGGDEDAEEVLLAKRAMASLAARKIRDAVDAESLAAAKRRVLSLSSGYIREVTKAAEPSDTVATVAAALCLLVGEEPSWSHARELLSRPNFPWELCQKQPKDISDHHVDVISKLCAVNDLEAVSHDARSTRALRAFAGFLVEMCPPKGQHPA